MFNYFKVLLKEIIMTRVITQEIKTILDEAVKNGKLDAAALKALQDKDQVHDQELADAKADLQAIADAIKNPALPPVETAETIADVLSNGDFVPGNVTPAFPA